MNILAAIRRLFAPAVRVNTWRVGDTVAQWDNGIPNRLKNYRVERVARGRAFVHGYFYTAGGVQIGGIYRTITRWTAKHDRILTAQRARDAAVWARTEQRART